MPIQSTFATIATYTQSSLINIPFTNIPQTYTDLFIVVYSSTQQAGNPADMLNMTINSDSGTNYSNTALYNNGGTNTVTRSTSQTSAKIGTRPAFATNLFGAMHIHIPNYSNTTTYKTIISRAASDQNGSGLIEFYVNTWRNTAAITRLDFSGTGNFPGIGSMITLYGTAAA